MLVPCLLCVVFGCLVGFWLCVEQFLFEVFFHGFLPFVFCF
jgi:hypothetical protein